MKNLNFKAMNGQMAVDEVQGIVECFVAAIGNKDSVGDIIVPGAFNKSFKKRKPRVVWGHDWNQPIGKVLDIYEVGPRDPRLPSKMKEAGVGGVFAKVQFNLNSERGREAFSNIIFFGEEQEWSIGYKTLDAVWDPNTQANVLKELELYEVSPVLHGANQLTATISIKDATGGDTEDEVTSLRDSKWDTFDIAWAKNLKDEHPDIWSKGGNIKGNDQWRILTQIAAKGKATTQAELNALKLREAWIARHKGDFRLPGVVAQIKWLAVGTRGEDYMKNLVREHIDKMEGKAAPGADKLQDLAAALGDRIPTGSNLVPDVLPQERVTGDILHGYGPRRGNLEKLLRYWRPIMRKEGGFRRCRVILADHPELYPLDNLCAWLHHETTGLWPNEGCHHPGMKNCRRKLKKAGRIVSGSLWSDSEFDNRLRKLGKGKKDGWGEEFEDEPMTPYEHWMHEMGESDVEEHEEQEAEEHEDDEEMMVRFGEALREFAKREPEFMAYLADDDNWTHEGQEHDEDDWHEHMPLVPMGKKPCGCGCGEKSADDDLSFKAGRILSGRNHTRLRDAMALIKAVLDESGVEAKDDAPETFSIKSDRVHDLVTDIAPVLNHHSLNVKVVGGAIRLPDSVTDEALDAIANAMEGLGYDAKGIFGRIGGAFRGGRGGSGGKGPKPAKFNPNAPDGDNDGIAQEGTTAEHPVAVGAAAEAAGKLADAAGGKGGKKNPLKRGDGKFDPVFMEGDFDNINAQERAYARIRDEFNAMDRTGRPLGKRKDTKLPNTLEPLAPHERPGKDGEYNDRYLKAWEDATPDEIREAQLWEALKILDNMHLNGVRSDPETNSTRHRERIQQILKEFNDGDITFEQVVRHLAPYRHEPYRNTPFAGAHTTRTGGTNIEIERIQKLIEKARAGEATKEELDRLDSYGIFKPLYEGAKPAPIKPEMHVGKGGEIAVPGRDVWAAVNDGLKTPTRNYEVGREGFGLGYDQWKMLTGNDKNGVRNRLGELAKHVENGDMTKAMESATYVQNMIATGRRHGADVPEWNAYLDGLETELLSHADAFNDSEFKKSLTADLVRAVEEGPVAKENLVNALGEAGKSIAAGDFGDPIDINGEHAFWVNKHGGNPEYDEDYYVEDDFITDELVGKIVHDPKTNRIGVVESVSDPEWDDDGEGGYSRGSASVMWLLEDGKPFDGSDDIGAGDVSGGDFNLYEPTAALSDMISNEDHLAEAWEENAKSQLLRNARNLYGINPDAALDVIYSMKDTLSGPAYEALLRSFRVSVGLEAGGKSLRPGEQNEWLRPVVAFHGIPYEVKDGRVLYNLVGCGTEAAEAFDMAYKRAYSERKRSEYAEAGIALPDGSFPIRDLGDLRNAIKAYGRAKDKPAAKRHIVKRARSLKATAELPEGWG
jgi:HK97 family phage prohead protease